MLEATLVIMALPFGALGAFLLVHHIQVEMSKGKGWILIRISKRRHGDE